MAVNRTRRNMQDGSNQMNRNMNGNMNGRDVNGSALKGELPEQIRALSFVKEELELYLDTHPDCTTALDYYHQTLAALKILTEKYEITESPLTASGVTNTERWSWVDGAWPWQQGNGAQSRKERK